VIETAGTGGPPARQLHRVLPGRIAAGVATGIAEHLGVPVVSVRVVFAVLFGFNGLGALLYAVFWAVLPVAGTGPARRSSPAMLVPYAALALGALLVRALVGGGGLTGAVGWLVALIALGAGIIWHQSTADGRRNGEQSGAPWWGALVTDGDRRVYLLRFAGGGLLIVIGVIGLAAVYTPRATGASVVSVWYGLVFAVLALAGVGLVTAPLLWRTFGALRTEREARIREQERAEFAAMVHDQVLHTLALIQRRSPVGSQAHRLARAQERTLRGWLYRPAGPPSEGLATALEEVAAEVEDAYGVTVELVVVGADPAARRGERIEALVAAAREALVNAARHAGVATVSLYAEVEPDQISVFVRDRGAGFDPATVSPGRHGLDGSVVGRMRRHGGRAEIISSPGEGTEVRLRLPLAAEGRDGYE
jgi:signal transduction histidine kinase/phage shock protein PspC (stress-responsive transcriptional regulator)